MKLLLTGACARFENAVVWLAGLGALIVLIQTVWISYGVMMRYVFDSPDGMVTEGSALLLFPVAFAGLAFALKEDAYPKVTMLTDKLPPRIRHLVDIVNMTLMLAVGSFFALAAVEATFRSYHSGAASEILLWPRYLFWAPGAVALVLFAVYAALRLALLVLSPPQLSPPQSSPPQSSLPGDHRATS